MALFIQGSNHYSVNLVRQHKFLTKMVERLSTESGQKEVLAEIQAVRKVLIARENVAMYIATNPERLSGQDLQAPWKMFSDVPESCPKSK